MVRAAAAERRSSQFSVATPPPLTRDLWCDLRRLAPNGRRASPVLQRLRPRGIRRVATKKRSSRHARTESAPVVCVCIAAAAAVSQSACRERSRAQYGSTWNLTNPSGDGVRFWPQRFVPASPRLLWCSAALADGPPPGFARLPMSRRGSSRICATQARTISRARRSPATASRNAGCVAKLRRLWLARKRSRIGAASTLSSTTATGRNARSRPSSPGRRTPMKARRRPIIRTSPNRNSSPRVYRRAFDAFDGARGRHRRQRLGFRRAFRLFRPSLLDEYAGRPSGAKRERKARRADVKRRIRKLSARMVALQLEGAQNAESFDEEIRGGRFRRPVPRFHWRDRSRHLKALAASCRGRSSMNESDPDECCDETIFDGCGAALIAPECGRKPGHAFHSIAPPEPAASWPAIRRIPNPSEI